MEKSDQPNDLKKKTALTWFEKLRSHVVVAVLSILVTVIITGGNAAEGLLHIWALVHPATTPLELAKQNAKSEFSRRLTQNAWERLYWMRSYAFRLKRGAPQPEIDYAWNKYTEASVEWNRNLMINYQALEEYYPGSGKGEAFLSDIQDGFNRAGDELRELRYPANQPKNKNPTESEVLQHLNNFDSAVDSLNRNLFIFVTTQDEGALKQKH